MRIQRRLILSTAVAALAAGLVLSSAAAQIAPPKVSAVAGQPAAIPFELYRGNRIYLTGRINGTETPMILDSGAGVTTLDKAFAAKIGLKDGQKIAAQGVGGYETAELYRNVTIEAGNLRLSEATVVALDLSQVGKAIGRPMPVVLGRELFISSIVEIDFDRSELTLTPAPGFAPPAGATEVSLKREGTLHFIPVSIGGLKPVDAAFDLGNGGAVSLSKEYHESQPLFASLPYGISLSGGVGGMHETKRVTLPSITMAGFTFEKPPADLGAKADGPYEGRVNVGIQMFRPFKLTMDLGHDRLWLQRTAKPATFAKDRAGMFTMLEGDHFNVLHVTPGGPADRAGIRKGDKLTAIDGEPVGPTFFTGSKANWARGEAGSKVAVAKSDGAKVTVTLADYY